MTSLLLYKMVTYHSSGSIQSYWEDLNVGCSWISEGITTKCSLVLVLLLRIYWEHWWQDDIPLPYLKLSEHLDYLGCRLYANYNATRRENGEILKQKIKDQLGSWKSGKFLPLTSRPWSLNTYCLSKWWYRTGCLDMRVGDSSAITSSVKSWLYQDMLEKPQEMVTFRQTELGGLGVHCVRTRAMAMLIHTFLAQAISPRFSNNQYCKYLLVVYKGYSWLRILELRDGEGWWGMLRDG